MKKKISLIFFIIAIVTTVFSVVILLYSYFIGDINHKYSWMWGATVIACFSMIIYDYLKKSKISGILIYELLLLLVMFTFTFYDKF